MRRSWSFIFAVSLALTISFTELHQAVWASTIVSVQPTSRSTNLGSSFEVTVNVTSVIDLFAFQFDLEFDSTVLSAVDISEGPFLPSGGTTFFVPGIIDNSTGIIAFTADSLPGAVPGVSGNGVLGMVTFSGV